MSPAFLLWLGASMVIYLAAATATRTYIASSNMAYLILSLALYCVGNLMMVRLMREGGLGLAISISAIAQLLFVNVIAVAVFGERLSTLQLAGVGLGAVAMVLMLFPSQARV
ncbi:hypothetical protein [Rhizobium sp. RU36D]|uniref:hypothetical protein n=1 Tax=Rhizobium sp. RU36D TaxID=1907415 RepID=UPI0009D81E5A|nr:hypothetical protein [Rhizobium sp. RU36D]SMC39523.1 glucose uptake protein [Rhizobium sp. RU36D]